MFLSRNQSMMTVTFLIVTLHGAASCAAPPVNMPGPGPLGGPSLAEEKMIPAYRDLAYQQGSATRTLDIYLPDNKKGPYPVVIYAHAGGFMFGDKSMVSANVVRGILKSGFAFVTVYYRLSREAKFPAAVQDFFSANEYVKEHAARYDLDKSRVAVFGESAGANLASLAGVAYDRPLFRKNLHNPESQIRPDAVIALYPPVDFGKISVFTASQGCPSAGSFNHGPDFEAEYIGGALSDNPDKVRQASPLSYISSGSSPFLIENGDSDCSVGTAQSPLLSDALKKAGVQVTYRLLKQAGHGGPPFETSQNIKQITDFLRNAFRP